MEITVIEGLSLEDIKYAMDNILDIFTVESLGLTYIELSQEGNDLRIGYINDDDNFRSLRGPKEWSYIQKEVMKQLEVLYQQRMIEKI